MSGQFPVETRYGVIWQGHIHDIFDCIEDAAEEAAHCVHFEKKLGAAKVIDLEIRPLHQDPCANEKDPVWVEHNPQVVNGFWNYCPMCGRKLGAP